MTGMPIPPSLWRRLAEFIAPGRHGKIEMDVKDGQVVGMRLIESVKPTKKDDCRYPMPDMSGPDSWQIERLT